MSNTVLHIFVYKHIQFCLKGQRKFWPMSLIHHAEVLHLDSAELLARLYPFHGPHPFSRSCPRNYPEKNHHYHQSLIGDTSNSLLGFTPPPALCRRQIGGGGASTISCQHLLSLSQELAEYTSFFLYFLHGGKASPFLKCQVERLLQALRVETP